MASAARRGLRAAAEFAGALRLDRLPAGLVDHARLVVLDTLGAIVAGMSDAVMTRLGGALAETGSGPSSVPTIAATLPPGTAAFLNGTAGTWHELDEGNYPTHQHPAIHVVPSALAVAEATGAGGTAMLEAVILGYELGGRTGRATRFRDAVMHPHGTHGVIGGAAAVAHLLGLRGEDFVQALNVASSMTVATSRPTVFEGATVRNCYAGQAGQNAVLAGYATRSGVTGEADGLGSVFGHVSGEAFDWDAFAEDLGDRYLLATNYFKLYACCAYNHASLDALQEALDGTRVAVSDVTDVEVLTYFPATRMTRVEVHNPLAAKFSLPYSVSAQLVLGSVGLEAFTPGALADPAIRALMNRVRVGEDPQATARYPREQRATITVSLRDGRRLRGSVSTVRGDAANPVAAEAVHEKFLRLAAAVIGRPAAEALVPLVYALGRDTDPAAIGKVLRLGAANGSLATVGSGTGVRGADG